MKIICENEVLQFDSSECFWVMVEGLKKHKKLDDDEIQNEKGVYIFFNHDEVPIRIGKAVKLRNRILSYRGFL